MLKKATSLLVAGVFAASLASASLAQDKSKQKAPPNCPVCNMPLATKKSDKNPVAVSVNKHVMYCCSGCDMSTWKKDKHGNPIAPAPPKK